MDTLLIEIGTEEIPAGYIIPALEAFSNQMIAAMETYRIDHGKVRYLGTPRRLTLMIEKVADMQKVQTSIVIGPPEKVGFDADGRPTIAAEKFAAKAGVPVDRLTVDESDKGRYLKAVVEEKCESSVSLLEKILEPLILDIPFPKSMRWGDLSISFARPIISLTGMMGDKSLKFKVGNIKSSPYVYGHRFMSPGKVKVDTSENYEAVLESAGIIVNIEKRREILKQKIQKLAQENNGFILEDSELLDTVTNLVEHPYPVVGKFDSSFLQVPEAVLITAMREHQKYFALVDENRKLTPMFIAVNNTKARDMRLVAKGHEKVLRARLSDAKFFWEQDKESSLDEFARKLQKVTFQEKLGTVYEKQQRIGKLGKYLVEVSGYEDKSLLEKQVLRAADICKADLVSQVVIEFTKLQGIIGRSYALDAGEPVDVADAIEQHYRPVYSGAPLPENSTACLLAIADKLDTICGCFSVDLIPTGGADPYALRRQGIGVLQIMMDQNLDFSLTAAIENGLSPFISDMPVKKEVVHKVVDFLQSRMINILTEMEYSKEAVISALSVSFDNIPDALLRVKALDTLRKQPDFDPLSITFKRVENILKKNEQSERITVDEGLFEDASEKNLYVACQEVQQTVADLTVSGDYDTALKLIASLRPKVDTFFEDVMVMAEDVNLRNNRIAILQEVSGLFKNIADFTKI